MTYNEQTAEWESRAQEIAKFFYEGSCFQVGPGTVMQKIVEAQREAAHKAVVGWDTAFNKGYAAGLREKASR